MSNKIMCKYCNTKSDPRHWLITTAFALGVSIEKITEGQMTLYEYFCPCCGLPNSIRKEEFVEEKADEASDDENFKDEASGKVSRDKSEAKSELNVEDGSAEELIEYGVKTENGEAAFEKIKRFINWTIRRWLSTRTALRKLIWILKLKCLIAAKKVNFLLP